MSKETLTYSDRLSSLATSTPDTSAQRYYRRLAVSVRTREARNRTWQRRLKLIEQREAYELSSWDDIKTSNFINKLAELELALAEISPYSEREASKTINEALPADQGEQVFELVRQFVEDNIQGVFPDEIRSLVDHLCFSFPNSLGIRLTREFYLVGYNKARY